MHQKGRILTQDDLELLNTFIKGLKTRIEMVEKLLNEDSGKEPSAIPGSFGAE